MEIVLTSTDRALNAAWRDHCGDLAAVTIEHRSILDVQCDAVVSPANSFGFMDGGIDLLYSQTFGWHVQHALQNLIRTRHHGELLVGAAEIVETQHPSIPFLIAAPTMRVPMALRNSPNPYLAARAVLLLATRGLFPDGAHAGQPICSRIRRVAFPGLGTGIGELDPAICARQVRAAICDVLLGDSEFPINWLMARDRHYALVQP